MTDLIIIFIEEVMFLNKSREIGLLMFLLSFYPGREGREVEGAVLGRAMRGRGKGWILSNAFAIDRRSGANRN